jgi:hypothetical protein
LASGVPAFRRSKSLENPAGVRAPAEAGFGEAGRFGGASEDVFAAQSAWSKLMDSDRTQSAAARRYGNDALEVEQF